MALSFSRGCFQPCTTELVLWASSWMHPIDSSHSGSHKSIQVSTPFHIQTIVMLSSALLWLMGSTRGRRGGCKVSSPSCFLNGSPSLFALLEWERGWGEMGKFWLHWRMWCCLWPSHHQQKLTLNSLKWQVSLSWGTLLIFQDIHKRGHPHCPVSLPGEILWFDSVSTPPLSPLQCSPQPLLLLPSPYPHPTGEHRLRVICALGNPQQTRASPPLQTIKGPLHCFALLSHPGVSWQFLFSSCSHRHRADQKLGFMNTEESEGRHVVFPFIENQWIVISVNHFLRELALQTLPAGPLDHNTLLTYLVACGREGTGLGWLSLSDCCWRTRD